MSNASLLVNVQVLSMSLVRYSRHRIPANSAQHPNMIIIGDMWVCGAVTPDQPTKGSAARWKNLVHRSAVVSGAVLVRGRDTLQELDTVQIHVKPVAV
jgi:hypothetical protein